LPLEKLRRYKSFAYARIYFGIEGAYYSDIDTLMVVNLFKINRAARGTIFAITTYNHLL